MLAHDGPVIFDMGTASFMWGEVMLHAHIGEPLPEGVGFDEHGNPSRDAAEVLAVIESARGGSRTVRRPWFLKPSGKQARRTDGGTI